MIIVSIAEQSLAWRASNLYEALASEERYRERGKKARLVFRQAKATGWKIGK